MYKAKVLADSVGRRSGVRLTTLEVTFPRFILAEVNTHRSFCLAGGTCLWFVQPNGTGRRKETLSSLFDKWQNGAKVRPSKRGKQWDTSVLGDQCVYPMDEVASVLGMATDTNLNRYCRSGRIRGAQKLCKVEGDRRWFATGDAIKAALAPTTNRQPVRDRLKKVALRQLDESDLSEGLTTINDIVYSGPKEVFKVSLTGEKHTIKASKDHLFLTPHGWKRLEEISLGDEVITAKLGKREDEKVSQYRWKKINGRWVNQWVKKIKGMGILSDRCSCGSLATEVHHIIPVHLDPTLAFEESNVEPVCSSCHKERHAVQEWQQGVPRYYGGTRVESIVYAGVEETYDISVEGEFPNFVANGFVVHNSRNSASSRAIPLAKRIAEVTENPFVPEYWGRNQKGMSASEEIDNPSASEDVWLEAAASAVSFAQRLGEFGVHKQTASRLLEPFLWHTAIISSTEWNNFFELRLAKDAQPEIQKTARVMKDALDASIPREVAFGDWHLPMTDDLPPELDVRDKVLISVGRTARVSYLTHDGKRDFDADKQLALRCLASRHMSPFEHVAFSGDKNRYNNFEGWVQLRWLIQERRDSYLTVGNPITTVQGLQ